MLFSLRATHSAKPWNSDVSLSHHEALCRGLQQSRLGILLMNTIGLTSAACSPIGLRETRFFLGGFCGLEERKCDGCVTRARIGRRSSVVCFWPVRVVIWSVMSYSYLVTSRAMWLWGCGQPLHPYASCPCPNPYALLANELESTSSAHSAQITEIDVGKASGLDSSIPPPL